MPTINVSEKVYKYLMNESSKESIKKNERVSMSNIIDNLIAEGTK